MEMWRFDVGLIVEHARALRGSCEFLDTLRPHFYKSEIKPMFRIIHTLMSMDKIGTATGNMESVVSLYSFMRPEYDPVPMVAGLTGMDIDANSRKNLSEFEKLAAKQNELGVNIPTEFVCILDENDAYDPETDDPDIPGPSSGKKRRYI
jgi:hypothetical protein